MLLAILLASAAAVAAAPADRPLKSLGAPLVAGKSGESLVFVVGGDNRPTGKGAPIPRTTRTIFEEIRLIRPDLVLWTGDSVYGYGDTPEELAREYDAFSSLAAGAGVPLFNAPGNHEIHRTDDAPCSLPAPLPPDSPLPDSEAQFVRRFGNLYGSFDAGPAHFIALDTASFCHEDSIDGEQLEWLRRDLEAHKTAAAIFVFCHTEFFSSPRIDESAGKDHPPLSNRDAIHALLRKYPVKAVFSGHEHLYWRESHDGIEYFVAGGAGAPLYAAPEQGGFSHYLLVQLSPAGIRYDVIEPGHLAVEKGAGKNVFWIVNSGDADIPLRGATVEVPRLASCAALRAESELRKRDGTPVPIPVAKLSCSPSRVGWSLRLGLSAPRDTSVPIAVRAAPSRPRTRPGVKSPIPDLRKSTDGATIEKSHAR